MAALDNAMGQHLADVADDFDGVHTYRIDVPTKKSE